jgi:ligand-binding sensor domain-containing protein
VFEIDKTLKIVGSFLIDYSVTSVVKDHEDGFWFSTLNSGVFYTKNVNLKYLANSSNITPTLLLIKNNNLLVMNNNKELHIFSKEGEFIETFNSVYHTNNLFSSPNPNLGRYLEPYVNFNLKAKIFAYYPSKPERNYHGENKIICKIGRDSLTKIKEFTNTPAIKDCFALNDSIILIATKKGLYSYNADTDSLLLRQKTYTLRK